MTPSTNPLRPSSGLSFPVVGVGASAGGIPALLKFFDALPSDPGMAFVVILHLSPNHESNADSILSRSTRMPVLQVSKTTLIEHNHVYVIPPTRALSMADGHLILGEAARVKGAPVVVDLFFRTLAQAHKERSVAIVLSGTGADGSVGLAEVKEQGGVVLAQSPSDAQYDGMPYYLFFPVLRRRTIRRSLGLLSLRVRPSGWPHGLTG